MSRFMLVCGIVFGLAGAVLSQSSELQSGKTAGDSAVPTHPLILTADKLVRLQWDPDASSYVEDASTRISGMPGYCQQGTRFLGRGEKHVFVRSEKSITRFDEDLKNPVYAEFKSLGSLRAHGKLVYISAEGKFKVLGADLKEIGSVDLDTGLPNFGKNAHDILIHDNTAFLLDNIMVPIFLFRVDVSDSRKPVVMGRIDCPGVNTHLTGQWLDPERDRWFVLRDSGTLAGISQEINSYSMKKGDAVDKSSVYDKPSGGKESGRRIMDVTRLTPAWAVVDGNGEGKYNLAGVAAEGKNVKVEIVPDFRAAGPIIREKGGYLLVSSVDATGQIQVVDARREPKVIATATLSKLGVTAKVMDICP